MSSPELIDDSNPAVQYVPGWIWETLVNEVDGTRHGAQDAGLSATLAFVGSGIQVIGTLQRGSGQPAVMFTVDGEGNTTYSAPPYTSSADAMYNVTFYLRRDLKHGNHELEIVNVNGTDPNTFWLDYFLVDPSPPSASTTSVGSSQSSSSPSSPSNTSVFSPGSPEATSSTSQPTKRLKTPAIVGGVIAGVVLLSLAGVLLFFLRRRHRRRGKAKAIQPFTASVTRSSIDGSGYASPSKRSNRPSRPTDSPSTRLEIATLDIGPASALAASYVTGSDRPSMDESSALPTRELPLEPVRGPVTPATENKTLPSDSGRESSRTSPAALPTDIGQALAHASPELQSTALTLIRSLLQRNQSQDLRPQRTEMDSGMRIYNDANMPPPEYTAD